MSPLPSRKKMTEKDNFSYLLFSLFFLLFSSAIVIHSLIETSLVIAFNVISLSIGIFYMAIVLPGLVDADITYIQQQDS